MPPPKFFETKLSQSWPPKQWQGVTVLLAVSGGADSVALLRAMVTLKTQGEGRLIVAHFNHRLRGEEADADESFVVQLCRKLTVPCDVERACSYLLEQASGDGIESAARDQRYAFLKHSALRHGTRYIVTAHTADDQAETVLHRIVRGTGIAGLGGIPRIRELNPQVTLIRPLLGIRRAEALAYLHSLDQPFCEDCSNQDTKLTRNRIRTQLLPQLAVEYNERVVHSLLRLGTLATEVQLIVDTLVDRLLDGVVEFSDQGSIAINCARLSSEPLYLVRELFRAIWRRQGWPEQSMTQQHWCELASFVSNGFANPKATTMFPGGIRAERVGAHVSLTRVKV